MKELGGPLRAIAAVAICVSMIVGAMMVVPSDSEAWTNDAQFTGYVKDGAGNPLPDSYVLVMYFADNGKVINTTFTDSLGRFTVGVPGGQSYAVFAANSSYYMSLQFVTVLAGRTAWVNFTLDSISPDIPDVTVKGFAKDGSGTPVTNGHVLGVTMSSSGTELPYYANVTVPNATGYFEVKVFASSAGGGAVAMDFPGVGMVENISKPIVAGQTYWLNLTMETGGHGEDAAIAGTVKDSAGSPLANVAVGAKMSPSGFSNSTFTDSAGNYRIDVVSGDATMSFAKTGYSTISEMSAGFVGPGETLWANVTLDISDAVIKGNVTDKKTGLPLSLASVVLLNWTAMRVMATTVTNATGYYEMYGFSGPSMLIGSQMNGYGTNASFISIASGEVRWIDFELSPFDSWITGTVTDFFNSTPIANAGVRVSGMMFDSKTNTDSSGHYNISVVHGNYNVSVDAGGYRPNTTAVVAIEGSEVTHDVRMLPWMMPTTVRLWGWVNSSISGLGIENAQVRLVISDRSYDNSTWTDPSGYYEIMAPPMGLYYRASARYFVDEIGAIDLTSLTDERLDIVLERDILNPKLNYSQSPTDYISWSRPSNISVKIVEDHLAQVVLSQLRYLMPGSGDTHVYYALTWDTANLDPWSTGMPMLDLINPTPGTYWLNTSWNGTVTGGWFGNGTGDVYIGATMYGSGSGALMVIFGNYSNASVTVPQPGALVLNTTTGVPVAFMFEDRWMYPTVFFPDATGQFSPIATAIEVNISSLQMFWWKNLELGTWSASDMRLLIDPTVPNINHPYLTLFSASDSAGNGNGTLTRVTVDNDVPIANASADQPVMVEDTTVTLSGATSTDDCGIANYTWTVTNESGPVGTYWGETVYLVLGLGNYSIDLTVTDPGGHTATDSLTVEAVHDAPPVAHAGPDVTADEDTVVQFNGSADDDVGIMNGTWTIIELSVEMWGPTPEYTFATPGVYHVQLVVTDTIGQTSQPDELIVTVNDLTAPAAGAGTDSEVSYGHAATFNGSLSTDNLAVTNWTWNFTDMGAHAVWGETATHAFSHPGVYLVTLVVRDAAGHTATDSVVFTVVDDTPPVSNAGADQTADVGEEVTFDGSSTADDVGVVNYTWTIRNNVGVVGTMWGDQPKHTFTIAGTYNVTLDASDAAGNHGTDIVRITVAVPDTQDPVAAAGADIDLKSGESVTFDGSSSTDNVGVVNYTWTFTYDGVVHKLYTSSPTFTFEKAGDYTVTLKVTDAVGNSSEDTLVVHVAGKAGTSTMLYAGAGIAVVAVILIALAMMMRQKDGPGKKGTVKGEDELEDEFEMPPPPPKDEL